jgi:putative endonuclease
LIAQAESRFSRFGDFAMRGLWAVLRQWYRQWCRQLTAPQPLGQQGEQAAARYLKRLGYRIVAHDDRMKSGEIDLVAVDGATIVFVEVKTRRSQEAGHPAEAVDAVKQRRLTRAAVTFLKRHGLLEQPARFDVVAITWPEGQRRPTIEHFPNAFDAVGQWEFYS